MNLDVIDVDLIDFETADRLQRTILSETKQGLRKNTLLLLRHKPVITVGRTGNLENVLADKATLLQNKIKLVNTDRGGDVTFHGPGQLVAWPIFNLRDHKKDVHAFLRKLEDVVIGTLSGLGIESKTISGKTGIWIDDKKISSIGISVSSWISFHGLSLNVEQEDNYFSLIRPCGLDVKMTCIRKQAPRNFSLDDIKRLLVKNFENIFFKEEQIGQATTLA